MSSDDRGPLGGDGGSLGGDAGGPVPADPRAPGVPVHEQDLPTGPLEVVRTALNRARADARARGLRPGTVRRSVLAEAGRSREDASGPGGRDPQLFSESVAALLRQRGWVQDVSVGAVVGRWREVVGEQMADHCTPESFSEGVLVVRTDTTAWANQIKVLVPQLLQRLAQEVGEDVVRTVEVRGPTVRGFQRGPRSVPGRGPRDTYG